jgi:hypothetical protein
MLPPKKPRVPMVLTKLYLPKPQLATLRRLTVERREKLATLLRGIITEWLAAHVDAEG